MEITEVAPGKRPGLIGAQCCQGAGMTSNSPADESLAPRQPKEGKLGVSEEARQQRLGTT